MNQDRQEDAGELARAAIRERTEEVGDEQRAEELLDVPTVPPEELAREQEREP